jgi:hypothetical protein
MHVCASPGIAVILLCENTPYELFGETIMSENIKQYTDFLVQLGTANVPHTEQTFLVHLIGVYRFIKERGCEEPLCLAGLFHSIYGTEGFQGFSLPLERRDEVQSLIGQRAERLAYLNCAMERASFDENLDHDGPYRLIDRFTGKQIEMSQQGFDDLCRVHLYDWLEQLPRCKLWEYRRRSYRWMAERLGEVAIEAYDGVFAQESADIGA